MFAYFPDVFSSNLSPATNNSELHPFFDLNDEEIKEKDPSSSIFSRKPLPSLPRRKRSMAPPPLPAGDPLPLDDLFGSSPPLVDLKEPLIPSSNFLMAVVRNWMKIKNVQFEFSLKNLFNFKHS